MIFNIMLNAKNISCCSDLSPSLSPIPESACLSHIIDRSLAQQTGEFPRQLDKGDGANIETAD